MTGDPKPLLKGQNPTNIIPTDELEKFQKQADLAYYELIRKQKEDSLREFISKNITKTFLRLNLLIYLLVLSMFVVDAVLAFQWKKPLSILDRSVVMTLIGATTVQLGALTIGMGKWLFPTGKK